MRIRRTAAGVLVPERHLLVARPAIVGRFERERRRGIEQLMRRVGGNTVYLSTGHNLSSGAAIFNTAGTTTFTVTRRCRVKLRGIGAAGGGSNVNVVGTDAYGGGGGGQGAYATGAAANLVDLLPGVTYAAIVGAGETAHAANAASAGGATIFRINAGTIYLQLNGGAGAGAFDGSTYPGGLGGTVATGTGTTGGAGGRGGDGGLGFADNGVAGSASGGGGGGGNGDGGNGGSSGGGVGGDAGGGGLGTFGGKGGRGGGPFGDSGAGGGGMGGTLFNATAGFDGYLEITLVSIL